MRLIIILFTIVSSLAASAQVTISINSGIGTYQLSDLKDQQRTAQSSLPVKAQIISSFPAFWFYELTATQPLGNNGVIGGALSYGSTGGRVSYSDYSGSIQFDQMASYYSITTLFGRRTKLINDRLTLQTDLRPGVTVTKLKMSYNETIGTSGSGSSSNFHAANFIIQPTLTLIYNKGPWVINAFAGYNFNLTKGEVQTSDNGGGILYNGSNKAYADWSGLRTGAGLGYKLGNNSNAEWNKVLLGFGVGLDYGGIGLNLLTYPQKNIGVFVGGGYALAGFGTNAGIKLKLANESKRVDPYITGMYGYNAAIKVTNKDELSKLFYGPSVGFGIDLASSANRSKLFSFGVLVPIRGSEVDNYINALKAAGVQFKNNLTPFTISVGFRTNPTPR